MHYAINYTGNSKTGVMPVTTSSKSTCPDTCSLKEKGCYAKYSFLGNYWDKLTSGKVNNSLNYSELLKAISKLSKGTLWRHNQAGDLLHDNGVIDSNSLVGLVNANKGKRAIVYTHHLPSVSNNASLIKLANDSGLTINLSSDTLKQADEYIALDIAPVVTLLQLGSDKVSYTPAGNKVVKCPADKVKGITCASCGLCALSKRDYIIGFEVHGIAKKSINNSLINTINI
jgi:hypothetical protein